MKLTRHVLPFAFVAPAILFLTALLLWPLIQAVILSLKDVRSVGTTGDWVGLANYRKLLTNGDFWASTWLSLVWVVTNAVLQTFLALLAALALNQSFPGVRIARTWVVLTWIVPTVVVVMIWRWLFSTSGGIVNPLLMQSGLIDAPVRNARKLVMP